MSDRTRAQLERAQDLFEIGQIDGAIEELKRALTEDPDIAEAHAWLAICLLHKRRLHAAVVEAGLAITLDPDSVMAHLVAAEVGLAKRDFAGAKEHIAALLAEQPQNPAFHRLQARWLGFVGKRSEQLPVLEHARVLDPNDPETLAELARLLAELGEIERARACAEEALRINPASQNALVAMGRALLLAGDVAGAREHAIYALRADPTAPSALALMTSIKIRTNPLLGAWWRYATWMERIGPTRSVIVLLGAFVLYRLAVIISDQQGATGLATGIQLAWLGVVVYSFAGPVLFRKALERELASVELKRF